MNQHDDIADRNLERLLGTAYKPEPADPVFVQTVEEYLVGVARELADQRAAATPVLATTETVRLTRLRKRFGWGMALAASVFVCFLACLASRPVPPRGPLPSQADASKYVTVPRGPVSDSLRPAKDDPVRQTAQPRPSVEAAKAV